MKIEFLEAAIVIIGILLYSYNLFFRHINNINKMRKKLKNLTFALVEVLEDATGYNDEDTGRHIKRISSYSRVLAERYGCSEEDIKDIEIYSSLHDLGKVGIPDKILKKPGKLTSEEWLHMMEHVEIGYNMVKKLEISPLAENIVRYHHERWDGKGYLMGLKGEIIPLEARIVALVDVYDALRQERVYKDSIGHMEAVELIKKEAGGQFEPRMVEAFLMDHKKFDEIFERYTAPPQGYHEEKKLVENEGVEAPL